jgi:hypothetical protein
VAHGLPHTISIDDEPPQRDGRQQRAWEQSVADNVTIGTTRHQVARGGKHMLKYWLVDPGVVLQTLVRR